MYLSHFALREAPFSITPDSAFYYPHEGTRAALKMLQALRSGEGFLKIIGEVGGGKTLLCRQLLKSLQGEFVTAHIPDPDMGPDDFLLALCHELKVEIAPPATRHHLLTALHACLLSHERAGRQAVVCIDEAQALPLATIESLRSLSNLETEKRKLLQFVLLGQPELDVKLQRPELRPLLQRITFSEYLGAMHEERVHAYLVHRMARAALDESTEIGIFENAAVQAITDYSAGIPRLINVLAHKCLILAYGEKQQRVQVRHVHQAAEDTLGLKRGTGQWKKRWARSIRKHRSPFPTFHRALGAASLVLLALLVVPINVFQRGASPEPQAASPTAAPTALTASLPAREPEAMPSMPLSPDRPPKQAAPAKPLQQTTVLTGAAQISVPDAKASLQKGTGSPISASQDPGAKPSNRLAGVQLFRMDSVLARPPSTPLAGPPSTPLAGPPSAPVAGTPSAPLAATQPDLPKRSPDEVLAQVQVLWSMGSHAAAIALLQQTLFQVESSGSSALPVSSQSPLARLARELARMLLANGQVSQALLLLTRLEPQLAQIADLWAMRANAAQRLGQHADAVKAYQQALAFKPEEPRWLVGLAISLASLGQVTEAGELAERVKMAGGLRPEVANYLTQLGVNIRFD